MQVRHLGGAAAVAGRQGSCENRSAKLPTVKRYAAQRRRPAASASPRRGRSGRPTATAYQDREQTQHADNGGRTYAFGQGGGALSAAVERSHLSTVVARCPGTHRRLLSGKGEEEGDVAQAGGLGSPTDAMCCRCRWQPGAVGGMPVTPSCPWMAPQQRIRPEGLRQALTGRRTTAAPSQQRADARTVACTPGTKIFFSGAALPISEHISITSSYNAIVQPAHRAHLVCISQELDRRLCIPCCCAAYHRCRRSSSC